MSLTKVSSAVLNIDDLYGFRNRIINGDMRIDQRNAGAAVTPTTGQYNMDRYAASLSQASKFSVQQNAGAVTPPVGFTNYLGVTSLSAYSVVDSDFFSIQQPIEGFNIADLGWGTASAQTITASFWVRSSLTGSFGGAVQNTDFSRAYPFLYTISAANTWEYKTITIPGDTTGTWLTTTGVGLRFRFSLGMGSDRNATAGAWAAGNFLSATGAVSVVGTNGATFYVTGVQLEKGTVATPFERRPYGTELALCQRYYYKIFPNLVDTFLTGSGMSASGTSANAMAGTFPVTMRIRPTALEQSGTASHYNIGQPGLTNLASTAVPTLSSFTTDSMFFVNGTVASGLQNPAPCLLRTANTAAFIAWSAEL